MHFWRDEDAWDCKYVGEVYYWVVWKAVMQR